MESVEKKVIISKVGNSRIGFPIEAIQSVERLGELTSLPKAPSYLKGVFELRDELVSVIDLVEWYGEVHDRVEGQEKILVLHDEEHETIGLLVDEATEIISYVDKDLQKVEMNGKEVRVVKQENQLILMVDIHELRSEWSNKKIGA